MIDIFHSFRRMPLWVQIWVAAILMPANILTLAFLHEPYGYWLAGLAIGGMALNAPIMFIDKGFGSLMALPHILLWTPLCALMGWLLWFSGIELSANYSGFLMLLLAIDIVSLGFDYPDALKWLKGDRGPA